MSVLKASKSREGGTTDEERLFHRLAVQGMSGGVVRVCVRACWQECCCFLRCRPIYVFHLSCCSKINFLFIMAVTICLMCSWHSRGAGCGCRDTGAPPVPHSSRFSLSSSKLCLNTCPLYTGTGALVTHLSVAPVIQQ